MKRVFEKQNLLGVAHVSYELKSKSQGPRQMRCTLYSVPVSGVEEAVLTDIDVTVPSRQRSYYTFPETSSSQIESDAEGLSGRDTDLTLINKLP